jgi:hypothetical protein
MKDTLYLETNAKDVIKYVRVVPAIQIRVVLSVQAICSYRNVVTEIPFAL